MKKLSYKKPLVEVMDFAVEDILKTSPDGTVTDTLTAFGLEVNDAGVVSVAGVSEE